MERKRTPVPAGRRAPLIGLLVALVAVSGVLVALQVQRPPEPAVIAEVPIPPSPLRPTPSPLPPLLAHLSPSPGSLLIISAILTPQTALRRSASVHRVDLTSGGVDTTQPALQQVVTRHGQRTYTLGLDAGETVVVGAATARPHERWITPITQTVDYIMGEGPSILALAPDERTLYVHSADATGQYWLQIVDTATGKRAAQTIPFPARDSCGAPRFLTPPTGSRLYIHCGTGLWAVETTTNTLTMIALPAPAQAAVLAPDGHAIYGIGSGPSIMEITEALSTTVRLRSHHLDEGLALAVTAGLVGLSADGTRLVVGAVVEDRTGTDVATDLRIYETTQWAEVLRIHYPRPLRTTTLAINADGSRVYGVTVRGPSGSRPTDTIVEFDGHTGQIRAEYVRPHENITQIQWLKEDG